MADYRVLVPFILRWEGGFVDDPLDRGGATNKGVTIGTWKTYCKRVGKQCSVATLKRMSSTEWHEIFKSMFWNRFRADEIVDQSIANILVDWLWASGVHAIKHCQRIVGVKDDGIVGPKTIAAINGESPLALFGKLHNDRIKFVEGIVHRNPKQKKYINGWKNRINSIHYGSLDMA